MIILSAIIILIVFFATIWIAELLDDFLVEHTSWWFGELLTICIILYVLELAILLQILNNYNLL